MLSLFRISRSIQPEIDGPLDIHRRLIWQGNLATLASRSIPRIKRVQYCEAIFSSRLRTFLATRAAREMIQLLRRSVVPKLLEHWIGPTLVAGRFLHCVAIAIFAERRQRVAHV